ncbi:conserved hypothetical protein (plasmid) [Borreliella burgdorferi 156a]|nr:conserved hypothetical protein [Borreliella burgdorferi 156a]
MTIDKVAVLNFIIRTETFLLKTVKITSNHSLKSQKVTIEHILKNVCGFEYWD